MTKQIICVGALMGMLAVILGAYGAHGLHSAPEAAQRAYHNAVQYQFYHSLALLVCGSMMIVGGVSRWFALAALGWLVGLVLFCGSIYLKVLWQLALPGWSTPLGGVAFIVGWLAMACGAWTMNDRSSVMGGNNAD